MQNIRVMILVSTQLKLIFIPIEHEEHIERRIVFKELPNEELQQKS